MNLTTSKKIGLIFYYLKKRIKRKFKIFWKEWGMTLEEFEMLFSAISILGSILFMEIILSIF